MNARGVVAIAVLAAWGAGVATFIQREANRTPRERLAEAAMRVAPGSDYFLVEEGGRHTGFASMTVDTIPEGLQVTEYAVRDDGNGGREVTRVVAHLTRGLWLQSVDVARGAAGAVAAVVRVIDDSTVALLREREVGADTTRHAFVAPLLLPSLVPLAVALGERPEVGDSYTFDIFDPAQLAVRRLTVGIRAESVFAVVDSAVYSASSQRWLGAHADTVRGWHLVEQAGAGLDLWVDELGRVIQSQPGAGITRRRTAYEVAFENWRSPARVSGTEPSSPDAAGALATRARGAAPVAAVRLRVTGLDLSRFDATTPWQRVTNDTVHVTHAQLAAVPSGYWLRGRRTAPAEFAREMQVAPWIEVDDPAIVAQARRIRAREADPAIVALRLTEWVRDSLRLEPLLTPPSAVAALRSRAGDVEHHVTLLVALARSAGIPARPVTGILVSGARTGPHTWAEVWVGQQWLPVDPALGQFPADAGHVRLLLGGVGARTELERLLARATLELLEVSAGPTPSGSP